LTIVISLSIIAFPGNSFIVPLLSVITGCWGILDVFLVSKVYWVLPMAFFLFVLLFYVVNLETFTMLTETAYFLSVYGILFMIAYLLPDSKYRGKSFV